MHKYLTIKIIKRGLQQIFHTLINKGNMGLSNKIYVIEGFHIKCILQEKHS